MQLEIAAPKTISRLKPIEKFYSHQVFFCLLYGYPPVIKKCLQFSIVHGTLCPDLLLSYRSCQHNVFLPQACNQAE